MLYKNDDKGENDDYQKIKREDGVDNISFNKEYGVCCVCGCMI